MAIQSGLAYECIKYARFHNLPLVCVVENNGKSVCTNTEEAWGGADFDTHEDYRYDFILPWPHAGAGKRVNF
jgi:pyruvate dehydrogenase E1 component alpha subunit